MLLSLQNCLRAHCILLHTKKQKSRIKFHSDCGILLFNLAILVLLVLVK